MNIGNQAHNGLAGKRASERPMSPFAPRQHVPSRIESRLLLAPFWRGSARLTRPRVKGEVLPHGDSPFRTLPKVTDGNWLLQKTFNFATLASGKNRGDVLRNSSHFATPLFRHVPLSVSNRKCQISNPLLKSTDALAYDFTLGMIHMSTWHRQVPGRQNLEDFLRPPQGRNRQGFSRRPRTH